MQCPLVLDPGYTSGDLQRLTKTMELDKSRCLMVKGKLLFFHAGGDSKKLRRFAVKELGAIQNIAKLYVQGLKADLDVGLQSSLAPFDVKREVEQGLTS